MAIPKAILNLVCFLKKFEFTQGSWTKLTENVNDRVTDDICNILLIIFDITTVYNIVKIKAFPKANANL